MVWRLAGVAASRVSTSGRKPRSSISSASSSTTALHVREVEVTLLEQVDHAAGGADDHVDAAVQRRDLRLVRAAAVDLEHADRAARAGGRQVSGHLHGELTRRDDDERLRLAGVGQLVVALLAGGDDAVQQRDAEAEGLAGTGLGLADDVVAGQRDRQGHRLDGERVRDAGVGQRLRRSPGGRRSPRTRPRRPARRTRCSSGGGSWARPEQRPAPASRRWWSRGLFTAKGGVPRAAGADGCRSVPGDSGVHHAGWPAADRASRLARVVRTGPGLRENG